MTNRKIMYATNGIIRKLLKENGFTDIFFFPHLRFQKDYVIDNFGFDAIAWMKTLSTRKSIHLFQIKTNQGKPSLAKIKEMSDIEKNYECFCLWINRDTKKQKIMVYNDAFKDGIEFKDYMVLLEEFM